MAAVIGVVKLKADVPAASVYHPTKVYPVCVGAVGAVAVAPHVIICGATVLPPWELKVTVLDDTAIATLLLVGGLLTLSHDPFSAFTE